jgi:hypothetical protein
MVTLGVYFEYINIYTRYLLNIFHLYYKFIQVSLLYFFKLLQMTFYYYYYYYIDIYNFKSAIIIDIII